MNGIKKGDRVRVWPGTKSGRSGETTATTDETTMGGSVGVYVKPSTDTSGREVPGGFYALTHIERVEAPSQQTPCAPIEEPMSKEPEPGMFANLIQTSLNEAVTPDVIKALVDAHVKRLVEEGISDALRSYSVTGKNIKNAVVEALRVGDGLNVPSYGHVVCDILARQIQACTADVLAAKLSKDMEGLLKLSPKEVKLSELIADLLNGDGSYREDVDSVWMEIEWEDDRSIMWMYINEGGEPAHGNHSADVRLLVRLEKKLSEHETIAGGLRETPKATICSGSVKGTDLQKDITFGYGTEHKNQRTEFGHWFGFEQKILAMYACGTVIELDEDNCILDKHDY